MQLEEANVKTAVLPSGLRVVVAPQPHLHRVHLALHVRVGARFETVATNGISHFLEHMLYRGTDQLRSAHEVNHAFEGLGSYLYGATHADFGVFAVTVPPECLPDATALFAHVLLQPAFFDMDIEKGIVCEEILEDLDDDGRQVDADNLSRALIYGTHPLGFTITGSERTVRSFDQAILRTHHARHYNATNAVLSVTGAVDPTVVFALAERHFAGIAKGAPIAYESPPPQKKPRFRFVENASSQTELRVCFRAPARTEASRAALDLLMRIVDDGMSTRLYHRICDSQGLCYDVSAGYDGYEDDGVIDFAAGVLHERTTRVTKEILDLVTELAHDGPTDTELARAKKRHGWHMRSMLDGTEELADLVALTALSGRVESPLERARAIEAVSRDQVIETARTLCDPKRLSVVAVGLLDSGDVKELEGLVKNFRG
jgi:predicted Zn-dependent peptidase